jgi:hypothetical protein
MTSAPNLGFRAILATALVVLSVVLSVDLSDARLLHALDHP